MDKHINKEREHNLVSQNSSYSEFQGSFDNM